MILLIIQLQYYYISNLKQYKTSGSLSTVFQYSNLHSSYTRSRFRKDNHQMSLESQKAAISTPDIGYSFFNQHSIDLEKPSTSLEFTI